MTVPAVLRGTYMNIYMGDGVTPTEGFDLICGLTSRSFTHEAEVARKNLRDCDDPAALSFQTLVTTGERWTFSGTGWLNRDQFEIVENAVGETKNYRVEFAEPAGDLVFGAMYSGAGKLLSLEIVGGDDDDIGVTLTFESSGQWTFAEV